MLVSSNRHLIVSRNHPCDSSIIIFSPKDDSMHNGIDLYVDIHNEDTVLTFNLYSISGIFVNTKTNIISFYGKKSDTKDSVVERIEVKESASLTTTIKDNKWLLTIKE